MIKMHFPVRRSPSRRTPVLLLHAGVLSLTLLAGTVPALAQADASIQPTRPTQLQPRERVGDHVQVTETNVSGTISGVVTAVHDQTFEVTPKGGHAVTIPYSQVASIKSGMSHRARVWTWIGVGAVVWIAIAIVAAHTT